MKKILMDDISCLQLDYKILDKLKGKVLTVKDLCLLSRKDLKEMSLNLEEINKLIIKLQLNGLDLGKKYK